MALEDFKRKLTAILSADVEEYSRLMGEDESATGFASMRVIVWVKRKQGGSWYDVCY